MEAVTLLNTDDRSQKLKGKTLRWAFCIMLWLTDWELNESSGFHLYAHLSLVVQHSRRLLQDYPIAMASLLPHSDTGVLQPGINMTTFLISCMSLV